MAPQIKTEVPGPDEINAIIARAHELRAEALAGMIRRLGIAISRLWSRRGLQGRPAH